VRKAISVVKKRSGPHEDTIRELWFDSRGVHLGPPLAHLRGVLTGVPVEVEAMKSKAGTGDDNAV
jgi:circadian clock protein KaiC